VSSLQRRSSQVHTRAYVRYLQRGSWASVRGPCCACPVLLHPGIVRCIAHRWRGPGYNFGHSCKRRRGRRRRRRWWDCIPANHFGVATRGSLGIHAVEHLHRGPHRVGNRYEHGCPSNAGCHGTSQPKQRLPCSRPLQPGQHPNVQRGIAGRVPHAAVPGCRGVPVPPGTMGPAGVWTRSAPWSRRKVARCHCSQPVHPGWRAMSALLRWCRGLAWVVTPPPASPLKRMRHVLRRSDIWNAPNQPHPRNT